MLSALILFAAVSAAPAKTNAPEVIPHGTALFLASMSNDGKEKVTFRAQALGTRYFFEEPGGVSVYSYDGAVYRRETFLKGTTLAKAMKKYSN